jgi:hypothetical protein
MIGTAAAAISTAEIKRLQSAAAVARARILNGKREMGNGKLVLSMRLESNVLPAFAAVSRRGIFLMVKSVIVL